jgi:hypothetical protein
MILYVPPAHPTRSTTNGHLIKVPWQAKRPPRTLPPPRTSAPVRARPTHRRPVSFFATSKLLFLSLFDRGTGYGMDLASICFRKFYC